MKFFPDWSWLYRSLFLANMFTVHTLLEPARTAGPEPGSPFRAHGRAAIRWCVCCRCTSICIRIFNILDARRLERVRRVGCAFGLRCSCCVIGVGTADEEASKKYLRTKCSQARFVCDWFFEVGRVLRAWSGRSRHVCRLDRENGGLLWEGAE